MRGLVSLLDDKNQISTTSLEGFWWKSQLNEVVIDGRLIGNIDLIDWLQDNYQDFSILITQGAGTISRLNNEIKEKWQ